MPNITITCAHPPVDGPALGAAVGVRFRMSGGSR